MQQIMQLVSFANKLTIKWKQNIAQIKTSLAVLLCHILKMAVTLNHLEVEINASF